jgi:hypothetical protein
MPKTTPLKTTPRGTPMMSAECLEALETLCQWMDDSDIDWDNIWPDDEDD